MIDRVFGIKVRMSGLCINRYRPIIGRLLDADYRPFRYRCISKCNCCVRVFFCMFYCPVVNVIFAKLWEGACFEIKNYHLYFWGDRHSSHCIKANTQYRPKSL